MHFFNKCNLNFRCRRSHSQATTFAVLQMSDEIFESIFPFCVMGSLKRFVAPWFVIFMSDSKHSSGNGYHAISVSPVAPKKHKKFCVNPKCDVQFLLWPMIAIKLIWALFTTLVSQWDDEAWWGAENQTTQIELDLAHASDLAIQSNWPEHRTNDVVKHCDLWSSMNNSNDTRQRIVFHYNRHIIICSHIVCTIDFFVTSFIRTETARKMQRSVFLCNLRCYRFQWFQFSSKEKINCLKTYYTLSLSIQLHFYQFSSVFFLSTVS